MRVKTFLLAWLVAFERGLDYRLTRAEVDTARLGCLGNPGGATQAAYFLGVEKRMKVAALCRYVASGERNLELTGAGRARLDVADWLIMFAPSRCWCWLAATISWTTPKPKRLPPKPTASTVLSSSITRRTAEQLPPSHQQLLARPTAKDVYSGVLPGVLQHDDLPDLLRALGSRLVLPSSNPQR